MKIKTLLSLRQQSFMIIKFCNYIKKEFPQEKFYANLESDYYFELGVHFFYKK